MTVIEALRAADVTVVAPCDACRKIPDRCHRSHVSSLVADFDVDYGGEGRFDDVPPEVATLVVLTSLTHEVLRGSSGDGRRIDVALRCPTCQQLYLCTDQLEHDGARSTHTLRYERTTARTLIDRYRRDEPGALSRANVTPSVANRAATLREVLLADGARDDVEPAGALRDAIVIDQGSIDLDVLIGLFHATMSAGAREAMTVAITAALLRRGDVARWMALRVTDHAALDGALLALDGRIDVTAAMVELAEDPRATWVVNTWRKADRPSRSNLLAGRVADEGILRLVEDAELGESVAAFVPRLVDALGPTRPTAVRADAARTLGNRALDRARARHTRAPRSGGGSRERGEARRSGRPGAVLPGHRRARATPACGGPDRSGPRRPDLRGVA
jgi:hypothetical protein